MGIDDNEAEVLLDFVQYWECKTLKYPIGKHLEMEKW